MSSWLFGGGDEAPAAEQDVHKVGDVRISVKTCCLIMRMSRLNALSQLLIIIPLLPAAHRSPNCLALIRSFSFSSPDVLTKVNGTD